MEDKIKILLVDDEADFRELMVSWLESKGYSVMTAGDGNTAVRLVKEETPDLMLLDLRMPDIYGAEALKKIRQLDKNLPVIVISAYVNDPRANEVLSYGVSGVFYKGKNFEDVLPQLESALRSHKRLKNR